MRYVTKHPELPVIPFLLCYAVAAATIGWAVYKALDRACVLPV